MRNIFSLYCLTLYCLTFVVAMLVVSGYHTAHAVLVTDHTDISPGTSVILDGSVSSGEYSGYTYSGSGGGFGGPLGGGTLFFESDLSNLYVGLDISGGTSALGSNLITIYLDTKSGGFSSDTGMSDTADPGRNVATNLTRDDSDAFPIEADYALQIGNGFTTLFELSSGSLSTVSKTEAGTDDREVSIALGDLGISPGESVTFFATLISNSNFTSDEGIPATGFSGGNPGFGSGGTLTWVDHHQFITAVPEPSAFLFGGLVCGVLGVNFARKRQLAKKVA